MNKQNRSRTLEVLDLAPARKKAAHVATKVVEIVKQPRVRQPKKKSGKANPGRRLHSETGILVEYAQTLEDPFEFSAIPLGYDTFIETEIVECYLNSSLTVNADGTFALALFPHTTGIYQNVAGAAVATWTNPAFLDATLIQTNYQFGRVVSGGLRVTGLQGTSSTPGILYAGCQASNNGTLFITQTPNTLKALPQSVMGLSTSGARSVTRPVDNRAYEFYNETVNGFNASTYTHATIPYIVGTNFPAGTVILFEAILNFECLPFNTSTNISASMMNPNSLPETPTLSDKFPSPQGAFKAVKRLLSSSVVMDFAEDLGGLVHPILGHSIRAVRDVFGKGRAVDKARSAQSVRQTQASEMSNAVREMNTRADPYDYPMESHRYVPNLSLHIPSTAPSSSSVSASRR